MSAIESWLREILRCPSCRSALRDVTGPGGGSELACTGCSLVYRIDDGIPVLLVEEARDRDADTDPSGTPGGDSMADPVVGQGGAGVEQSGL
jgi:uncharacterized protein YbaR (Trm112 family)